MDYNCDTDEDEYEDELLEKINNCKNSYDLLNIAKYQSLVISNFYDLMTNKYIVDIIDEIIKIKTFNNNIKLIYFLLDGWCDFWTKNINDNLKFYASKQTLEKIKSFLINFIRTNNFRDMNNTYKDLLFTQFGINFDAELSIG